VGQTAPGPEPIRSLTKFSNVWNIRLLSNALQYFYLSSNTLQKNSHSLTKLSNVWNICPSFNTLQYFFLSSNTLQYFLHSLTKLSDVYVIACANWRPTIFLWASEGKEQCRKHRKRVNESLLKCFWKYSSLHPFSSSSPISSSF
jgi:hypothetical protein